jgi:dTMP kinase
MRSVEKALGLLVALEGVDAVGKRTQSSLLSSWLRSNNVASESLSFPDYGTHIGQEIKGFLLGDRTYSAEVRHMLYAVNRWEKKNEIESLRSRSDVLVVNRYSPSNLAYGIANGLKLDWLNNLEVGLPEADLVLVLDAPPSVLSSRKCSNKDKYELNISLQEKVRDTYLELAKEFGWTVISADRGIQETHQVLVAAVSETITTRGRPI